MRPSIGSGCSVSWIIFMCRPRSPTARRHGPTKQPADIWYHDLARRGWMGASQSATTASATSAATMSQPGESQPDKPHSGPDAENVVPGEKRSHASPGLLVRHDHSGCASSQVNLLKEAVDLPHQACYRRVPEDPPGE